MLIEGKKVLIFGLGQYRNGSGISAAKFFLRRGAKLTVTDLKTASDLKAQITALEKLCGQLKKRGQKVFGVRYVMGRHAKSDFQKTDWVIRNPSVRNSSPLLKLARAAKVPIDTDISLFLRLCPAKVIGITGTRGKSTTTTLIYKILQAAYGKNNVFLGGNILNSPLNFLPKLKPHHWVVLELSSWQTESLAPFKLSPHISVITNLYPDHLNSYTGMAEYGRAKEEIFRHQKPGDWAVVNYDNVLTRPMGRRSKAHVLWFGRRQSLKKSGAYIKNGQAWAGLGGTKKILPLTDIQLPGEHNIMNVLAATLAGLAAGAKPKAIRQAVREFKGLANRLELVRTVRGVSFYNDTTATTAEGTIAALNSFAARRTILIAGGSDKNLPFDGLAREIIKRAKGLILFDTNGGRRIADEIAKVSKGRQIYWAKSMLQAVKLAASKASRGNIVLMSPACASFGMYKNEFDRGRKFIRAVGGLKNK